ncbi:helix-turn-helix domain-containing protein [Amycolatopsis acidicola]|uniref:Helix-turn-helix domain-containing protein n=1 Tax=Amycolatopsis acidicola TaxID=2596893 RepID=A0A5N0UVP4_9PSEU|nr:helix-turn-helix transcriptional regulator [Amycolatopsis acidicola]KAA9154703.1 helix-turn-helix domain-containing protein [Amycolatopsis acidicola]
MKLPPVAGTPTGRRFQLAALLKHLREERVMTQETVGRLLWPGARAVQNKLTRLENGDSAINQRDLSRLLEIYQVLDPITVALAMRLCDGTSQRGRWRGYRASYEKELWPYIDLEEDAEQIRMVGTEQLPGLLQCESYVRAEFGMTAPAGTVDAAAEAVRARQAKLLRPGRPAEIYAVLSESCLRRVRGNDEVMHEQLEYLLELSYRPNLTLQVAPFRSPSGTSAAGLLERFILLRLSAPGVISDFQQHLDFVFTRVGGRLTSGEDVHAYEDLWRGATSAGLDPERTRRFLREVSRGYRYLSKEPHYADRT